MNNRTNTTKRFSFPVFLTQLAVAFIILFVFSLYVWGAQLKYDELKVGYERAFFYSLLIFGAGFSYDCAKTVMLLDQITFKQFVKRFTESVVDIVSVLLLIGLTILFLSIGYTFWGELFYLFAIGWTLIAIRSISNAVEVASK